MDLYFSSTAGGSDQGDNAGCWFEDSGFTQPHGMLPTSGDNAKIWEGTCSSYSFTCDQVEVMSGATLSSLGGGQTLIQNQGTVTSNSGTITTNTGGATVTTNTSGGTVDTNNPTVTITTNNLDATSTDNE